MRGALRRAATAAAAVLAAVAAAAAAEAALPLTGEAAPAVSGLGGSDRPPAALDAAWTALAGRPTVLVAALVLAVAAAFAPLARGRGLWAVAAWGTGLLGGILLVPAPFGGEPVAAAWAVPAVWLAASLLVYGRVRRR
ncbi:MAG TPA: hypothetical protein VFR63_03785 [Gaiellaceae bacterium]|nr:hypothetical protein [Gaiellaceae bacterium]